MIPRVELMYNYEYAKLLYRGKGQFEDVWRSIIGLGADFEKIFDEYKEFMLTNIEKYSGFSWEEHCEEAFPVYIAEIEKSISHPLTLKVSSEPEKMTKDLIVQLTRRNMFFGFLDEHQKQKCINSVADHILKDLKLKDIDSNNFDLKNKTIKQYIRK